MRLWLPAILVLFLNATFAQDMGQKLFKDQEYDRARAHYESILSKRKNDKAAHFGRGASAYYQNDRETSVQSFNQVLDSEDELLQSKALYNLGNILNDQQKTDESLALYKKAMELDPSDEDAKINYELLMRQVQKQEQQNQDQDKKQESTDDQNRDQKQQQQDDQKSEDEQQQDNESAEKQDDNQDESQDQSDQQVQDQKAEPGKESSQPHETESQPKSDRQVQAEAILNALKDNDKIYQKQQISRSKMLKLEKDW